MKPHKSAASKPESRAQRAARWYPGDSLVQELLRCCIGKPKPARKAVGK